MSGAKEGESERVLSLYCQKDEDTFTIMLGPGWVPKAMRPFLNEEFESHPVLLDLEYLKDTLEARGAQCEIRYAKNGSVQLTARGESTKSLARWLGSSLASGLVGG